MQTKNFTVAFHVTKIALLITFLMQKKKKTLKVACVVKIKLLFYGLVLLQFDNTDYLMQNTIQKFRRSSIVFKKPGIFSENLKTLTSSNYPTVQ